MPRPSRESGTGTEDALVEEPHNEISESGKRKFARGVGGKKKWTKKKKKKVPPRVLRLSFPYADGGRSRCKAPHEFFLMDVKCALHCL